MAINYTQDMVDLMRDRYSANPTRETVEELARELDKSIKSVIGKLSREPITKRELVERIGEVLGIEYQALAGLEKSPKQALKSLTESLVLNLKPEEWESL